MIQEFIPLWGSYGAIEILPLLTKLIFYLYYLSYIYKIYISFYHCHKNSVFIVFYMKITIHDIRQLYT